MVQGGPDAQLFGHFGQRQQLLEIGVPEPHPDFLGRRHLHDFDDFGKHFALVAHEPDAALLRVAGAGIPAT
jgi:hypothetical protein